MVDEDKEEKTALAQEGGGDKKKVLLFSGVGLTVIIGAAFLFATFAVPAPPEDPNRVEGEGDEAYQEKEPSQRALDFFDVPVIMVNLKSTNKKRVLKLHINVVFEANDPDAARGLFEKKLPEIKNALTIMLTEKTMEDLEGRDDLNQLQTELLDELNRVVFEDESGEIKKIYYEEFIIQ